MHNIPIIQPMIEYEIHLFAHFRSLPVLQGGDGFLYATLASLCRLFGLNEEKELARIKQHTSLRTKLAKVVSNDKLEQLCLRIGFIGIWLLNLPVDAVDGESDRKDLITFQQNAAQVLEEAFCTGRLTEWPLIAELLKKEDPAVTAYKEAVAIVGLARDQLIIEAKARKIFCD